MGLREKKIFWVGEYASRESNPELVQVFCAIVAAWSSRDQGESQATSGIHNWCTNPHTPYSAGFRGPLFGSYLSPLVEVRSRDVGGRGDRGGGGCDGRRPDGFARSAQLAEGRNIFLKGKYSVKGFGKLIL